MKLSTLEKMFFDEQTDILEFSGFCHDCKKEVVVEILNTPEGITIIGGAIYAPDGVDKKFLKCESCHSIDPILKNYQPVQNYSRCVTDYLRPISAWNEGKLSEFSFRKNYSIPTETDLVI